MITNPTCTTLKILLASLLLFALNQGVSQEVRLNNGSFEGDARMGVINNGNRTEPPSGWFDCGAVHFPNATPPDIHKGSTNFWDNELGTYHGNTYMAMVVREDDSYESVSQMLSGTLKAGKCYTFSIYLAKSPKYMSLTTSNKISRSNFSQPAVLRVWGGNLTCQQGELLAESEPVENKKWQEYKFIIEPTTDYKILTLEAYFKTPVFFGYNGHICLDNASDFRIVDCDEPDVQVVAEAAKPKEKTVIVPAHKRKTKRETVVFENNKKEEVEDTVVFSRDKKILDLDRSNMKLGLTIKLEKLYFDADQADISVKSFDVLNEIGDFLNKYPEIELEVGGHTNNKPPDYYCDSLSTARAKSVADYLVSSGIEDGRITHKGYGKRQPIATNKTQRGRTLNQRVQLRITGLEYKKEDD